MPINALSPKRMAGDLIKVTNLMAQAEVRAVNKAGKKVRTTSDREIRKRIALPQKHVLKSIRFTQAQATANPTLAISVYEKGIPYRVKGYTSSKPHYKATQLRRGAKLTAFKGKPKLLKSSFAIREAGQGKKANSAYSRKYGGRVFKRTGEKYDGKGRYKGQKKDKFEVVWGPTILSQFKKTEIQRSMDKRWQEELPKELRSQEDFALKQAGFGRLRR